MLKKSSLIKFINENIDKHPTVLKLIERVDELTREVKVMRSRVDAMATQIQVLLEIVSALNESRQDSPILDASDDVRNETVATKRVFRSSILNHKIH